MRVDLQKVVSFLLKCLILFHLLSFTPIVAVTKDYEISFKSLLTLLFSLPLYLVICVFFKRHFLLKSVKYKIVQEILNQKISLEAKKGQQ